MLPQIPDDWDNVNAWEAYYQEYCAEERWRNWVQLQDLAWPYVSQLAEKGVQKVWFPGCGASLAPRLYAALGFEVWATDLSQTAIDFQRWLMTQTLTALGITALLAPVIDDELDEAPTTFEAHQHNFREPPPGGSFDALLNLLSFQGLSSEAASASARAHFSALCEGGWGVFVMGNLSRSKRPPLEAALHNAGFFVPYYSEETWYREALSQSQIPHRFVSQRPAVRIDEEPYRSDKKARDEAQHMLTSLEAQYNSKMRQADPEISQKLLDGSTRVALIVYAS